MRTILVQKTTLKVLQAAIIFIKSAYQVVVISSAYVEILDVFAIHFINTVAQ